VLLVVAAGVLLAGPRTLPARAVLEGRHP